MALVPCSRRFFSFAAASLLAGASLLACEGTRSASAPGAMAADGADAPSDEGGGARAALPDEDGYDLWLRYRLVTDATRLAEYRAVARVVVGLGPEESPTLAAARAELERGLSGLLGAAPATRRGAVEDGSIVLGTLSGAPELAASPFATALATRGPDAFAVHAIELAGRHVIAVAGTRGTDGMMNFTLTEATSNLSLAWADGAASGDLKWGTTKIGEVGKAAKGVTFSNGEFMSLDIGL